MINTHECEDMVQERMNHVAQNNEVEINEPCCAHFNKKDFNKLLIKSSTNQSTKHIVLNKRFCDETTDCVEFNIEDSDMLNE